MFFSSHNQYKIKLVNSLTPDSKSYLSLVRVCEKLASSVIASLRKVQAHVGPLIRPQYAIQSQGYEQTKTI
jgi:hypothetical protein